MLSIPPILHESQLFYTPPMQWLSWRVGNYRCTRTHRYIHIHILNRFNFILCLLPFQLMTPADMSAALNNSSPFFPVLHLPQVSSTDASGMLFDDCLFTNVQVSSGAIYFSYSNIYADLALMIRSLYCSVRKLLPSLCKTHWALGCSVFLEVQSCSPSLPPLWPWTQNSLLWNFKRKNYWISVRKMRFRFVSISWLVTEVRTGIQCG